MATNIKKEGGLEAPTRHPLNQHDAKFRDEQDLNQELARVFDICHGCRRCVNLCNAFPTLFDLVDESDTMEVDGVAVADYQQVVDQCYLCDLCYLTKCPYVPPHEWNVDFPHLMLRAKVVNFENGATKLRDNLITSTDMVGKIASKPIINAVVNSANKNTFARKILEKSFEIHKDAKLPEYTRNTLQKILPPKLKGNNEPLQQDKVVLFATCYCNYNEPDIGESLVSVFNHNNITVDMIEREHCCGMPKLELGDLKAVDQLMERNLPQLYQRVQQGWSIVACVPSCVLMFKQELPLLYPEDHRVQSVAKAFYDPFEYLHKKFKSGTLNTDFKTSLGKVSYHVACHQRVQSIGPKTKQILELIPDTTIKSIERCSGHDGTYGVKKETFEHANKIARPVVRQVQQFDPDHFSSDCPIAGKHIEYNLDDGTQQTHPIQLLQKAYGI